MRMLIAVTSSNYGHIVRIADVAGVAARLARGDENQIVVVQLAPATHIASHEARKNRLSDHVRLAIREAPPFESLRLRSRGNSTADLLIANGAAA
jgi:hypothetical protein